MKEDFLIGQYVLVRTYSAGLFAGTLKKISGKRVLLENCRRLWRWHTANNGISISEIAVYGLNHEKSKICCIEAAKLVRDVEISPCTEIARKSIESAPNYIFNPLANKILAGMPGNGNASASGDGNGSGEGHAEGACGYGFGGGLGRGSAGGDGDGDGSGNNYSSSDRD